MPPARARWLPFVALGVLASATAGFLVVKLTRDTGAARADDTALEDELDPTRPSPFTGRTQRVITTTAR